jgi:hypothetical protein
MDQRDEAIMEIFNRCRRLILANERLLHANGFGVESALVLDVMEAAISEAYLRGATWAMSVKPMEIVVDTVIVERLRAEVQRCRQSAAVFTADFTAGVEHALQLANDRS